MQAKQAGFGTSQPVLGRFFLVGQRRSNLGAVNGIGKLQR